MTRHRTIAILAAMFIPAALLEEAHQRYEVTRKEVRVIGIAIQDTPEAAQAFAKKFGKHYFLALDNAAGDIALSYGLYGVPETFFIDAQGIIREKQVGPVTRAIIVAQVNALLDQRQASR